MVNITKDANAGKLIAHFVPTFITAECVSRMYIHEQVCL